MIVSNKKVFSAVNFDQYLTMPGLSYSGIKGMGGKIVETEKMKLGKKVDAYLFTPHDYQPGPDHAIIKALALAAKTELAGLKFSGQLSYTADFTHEGKTMAYKGRPDIDAGALIVDLKVSELNIIKAIEFFRYDWQVSGYVMASSSASMAMLLSINPKTRKVSKMMLPIKMDWWQQAVKMYGK
jgi:hypothetical protein